MDRDSVNTLCATLPGAEVSAPFGPGHDIWKVGGKIFAALGAENRGVSVKCADIETAQMLIDTGIACRARYFHRSWVNLSDDTEDSELLHRVTSSYDLVRGKLPKKLRDALPVRAEEEV